jgi:hypothetical protein
MRFGDGRLVGYYENEQETAAELTPDPFSEEPRTQPHSVKYRTVKKQGNKRKNEHFEDLGL